MELTPDQVEIIRKMEGENVWTIDAYLMREWKFNFNQCIDARNHVKNLINEQETLKESQKKEEGVRQENPQSSVDGGSDEEGSREDEGGRGGDGSFAEEARRIQEEQGSLPVIDIDTENIDPKDLPF